MGYVPFFVQNMNTIDLGEVPELRASRARRELCGSATANDRRRTDTPPPGRNGMPGHRSYPGRARAAPVIFKRILVPVDFRAGSSRALQQALALAHQARILALHVTPPICINVDCGYGPVNRQVPDE